MKRLFIAAFFCFFTFLAIAQEVIVPASGTGALQNTQQPEYKNGSKEALVLPFFDDFYQNSIYPDALKWDGNEGFQNQDFGVFPVTQGVLTLDALDENGHIHDQALPGPSNWIADIVSSQPIRLDSIFSPNPVALHDYDSLYFSFWFQPGGGLGPHPFNDIGTPPESQDSLVLEFLAPAYADTIWIEKDTIINGIQQTITVIDRIDEAWDYAWSSEGMLLDTLIKYTDNGNYFMKVMIPIVDEDRYFHKDFRFRFKNYVSLSSDILTSWQSNADMWNIDYVYLDKDRTIEEQGVKDLAFVNKAQSLLNDYYSMPFAQYRENYVFEMIDSATNYITNLDNISYNMGYRYRITNEPGALVHEYNGGSFVINPFTDDGYISHKPFSRPPAQFIFPISNADSAEFTVTHFISSDQNLPFKGNDTTSFTQRFYNYYAYDNGTAENGYGIEGDDNGMAAIRFKLNKSDTLRGINIFFNEIIDPPTDQYFYLTVWNHNDRIPGSIVYEQYEMRPAPTDYRNNFHTFILEEPVIINQENFPYLIFYIGWQKDFDDEILNIGYDRSRDSKANNFYNVNGTWYNSMQSGSIMIRPLLGKTLPYNTGITALENSKPHFSIYPNPVNGNTIHLQYESAENLNSGAQVIIRNASGLIVKNTPLNDEISVQGLPAGLYIAHYTDANGMIYTSKFIITK